MAADPLAGVRAKLERAGEHLQALDNETTAFFDSQPYGLIGEFEPQNSSYVFRIERAAEPPPRLGVILGDAVHNLRSALDHVVWCLVERAGRKPGGHTYLPALKHRNDFISTVLEPTKGKLSPLDGIDAASPEWALIEAQQPYNSSDPANHFLATLAWLSNHDKHRVVHASWGFLRGELAGDRITFHPNEDAGTITDQVVGVYRRMEDGAEVGRVVLEPTGPDPQVEMRGRFPFEVAFGDRALRGKDIRQIAEYVARLTASLSKGFL